MNAGATLRTEAGLSEEKLLRSVDDANEVIMVFAASDLSAAKEFCASPEIDRDHEGSGRDRQTGFVFSENVISGGNFAHE